MSQFQKANSGGPPFPRNEEEWIARGLSPDQASLKLHEEVFGAGYQTDQKTGAPIESGRGSPAHQTKQHLAALARGQEAKANHAMRIGWHPGLDAAFDPKTAA